jgi:hypothetical protein
VAQLTSIVNESLVEEENQLKIDIQLQQAKSVIIEKKSLHETT